MSVLRDDTYSRGTLRQRARQISGLHFALLFLSLALLVLSRLEHSLITHTQTFVRDAVTAPARALAGWVEGLPDLWTHFEHALDGGRELARLRSENAVLRAQRARLVELENKVSELERLVDVVPPRAASTIAAPVIARANGPFSRAITIAAGREDGAAPGQPVLVDGSYAGYLLAVGERSSRVLLLDDVSSRIPVAIGEGSVPAIAMGENRDRPRLNFMARDARIREGDLVVTSGAAGVLPLGLRIGFAVRDGSKWRVDPMRTTNPARHVQVLLYTPGELASQLPSSAEKSQPNRVVRALGGGISVRPAQTDRDKVEVR
jgi:rod shape-determining protein MreC